MTAGLPETPGDDGDGTVGWGCGGIPPLKPPRVRMLEDEPAPPGVDVRHAAIAALLLRLTCRLNANALEMTRFVP